MRTELPLKFLAALILAAGAVQGSVIVNGVTEFVDGSVPVPVGARGVVRFFPGGGMGTLGPAGWAPTSLNLGFVDNGTLSITVQDLGPATCNGLVCTPNGPVYPGNSYLQGDIFEAILNQQTLNYTEPVTVNGEPTTAITFVPNLNSFTFVQNVTAGNYSLTFDDLTIAYLGLPAPKWPAPSVYQVNGNSAVPNDFETDAFEVTVVFSPEPSTSILLALGLAMTLVLARRRHFFKPRKMRADFGPQVGGSVGQ
jgi:hypothetical protein